MTGQEAPLSGLDIDPIADPDVDAVVALWRACGLTRPWNDPYADIALARRTASATVAFSQASRVTMRACSPLIQARSATKRASVADSSHAIGSRGASLSASSRSVRAPARSLIATCARARR